MTLHKISQFFPESLLRFTQFNENSLPGMIAFTVKPVKIGHPWDWKMSGWHSNLV